MIGKPSEQDYADAADKALATCAPSDLHRLAADYVASPWFRAAVDSAFAAGQRAAVPPGSETREEWGVIVHGRYGDLWDGCGDRKSAEREVEAKRVRTFPREVGKRKVIWTPPVPDTKEGDDA